MDALNPDSKEFKGMAPWERCFWLSRAYTEASICLLRAMLEDEFSQQYSSSRVVIHLARQGLELFLKGAILSGTSRNSLPGHNLVKLFKAYREKFPSKEFAFDAPMQFALGESDDLFPLDVDQFHSTLDQRHRYPNDLSGRGFDDPEEFDPRQFLASIEGLDKQLKVIEFCSIRPAMRAAGKV